MRRVRLVLTVLSIAAAWASPACKSNEVNQTENTTNNFSTIVGKDGKLFDGPEGIKIWIPPGALQQDTEIKIHEAEAAEHPPIAEMKSDSSGMPTPHPFANVGKVWAFEPHGLKFYVDATMWLPAPAGQFIVYKAQPGGTWQSANGYDSVDGKVEFKTSSFSFYTLRDVKDWFGPGGDASTVDPCKACIDDCTKRCGGDSACRDGCATSAECQPACTSAPPDASTGGDAGIGETGGICTPMCPPSGSGFFEGAACKSCGSPKPCTGLSGTTELRCTCEPKSSGDPGGMLTNCMPTGGGTDTGVTDTAPPDTSKPSTCPTMTQTEGTATFSAWTPVSAYAFYKENLLGSTYYSQLWLVLSDKPDVCTRAVSRQGAANSKTLRIRLEARNTTTPTVFTAGTYASSTAYGVIGMTDQYNATCGPTGTPVNYNNGTIVITEVTGGRHKGTFNFPTDGVSPASSGSFDVPTCAADGGGGGVGDPECCK